MRGVRGQGAMEYLVTYSWAVLIVMVVGVVMWKLGIFNLGSTTVTSSGFAKIKPQLAASGLVITGVAAGGGTPARFSATFTNAAGTRVYLTDITVTDEVGASCQGTVDGVDLCGGDGSCTPAAGGWGSGVPVASGENILVGIDDCPNDNGVAKPGDTYNVEVVVDYNVLVWDRLISHTDVGGLRGPYE